MRGLNMCYLQYAILEDTADISIFKLRADECAPAHPLGGIKDHLHIAADLQQGGGGENHLLPVKAWEHTVGLLLQGPQEELLAAGHPLLN